MTYTRHSETHLQKAFSAVNKLIWVNIYLVPTMCWAQKSTVAIFKEFTDHCRRQASRQYNVTSFDRRY